MKHLCLICERGTDKVLAEYTVEAEDWYYASHQAAGKFEVEHGRRSQEYYVDSTELNEQPTPSPTPS